VESQVRKYIKNKEYLPYGAKSTAISTDSPPKSLDYLTPHNCFFTPEQRVQSVIDKLNYRKNRKVILPQTAVQSEREAEVMRVRREQERNDYIKKLLRQRYTPEDDRVVREATEHMVNRYRKAIL